MVFEIHEEEEDSQVDPDGPGGKYGYRIGHSDGSYKIPDRVLNTVDDRNVRSVVHNFVPNFLHDLRVKLLTMEQGVDDWCWHEWHPNGTSDST